MTQSLITGPLVIVGGSEDHNEERKILREFVNLSGPDASIVIITVASESQAEVGSRYVDVFNRLGCDKVRVLTINKRGDANTRGAVEAIENATGVFFTGGNQLRITRLLGGTKLDTALHRQHERGLVLAGTSAGAAMMPTLMVTGGRAETAFRIGIVELGSGMGSSVAC